MKVLFNAFSACRLRTGVGCYAKNLLAALHSQAGPYVQPFPTGLMAAAIRAASRLSNRRPANAALASHTFPKGLGSIRQSMSRLMRNAGRELSERGFRLASQRREFDLYHEPNFIPWPCEIPAVATVHDLSAILHPEWHPPERARFHERHFERGLHRCEHLIADSECVRRELIQHFGISPRRVTAIHLGVGSEFRPMDRGEVTPVISRLALPKSFLLYVGTIEPRKNLLTLLRAYCDLPESTRTKCSLVLAGAWGWNYRPVHDYFESIAKDRGVVHAGYVADDDLPALYNGARALVYPSHYEGFGLPPIEMMACGGPVLASSASTLREVCGQFAHYSHPDDLHGWRDAMYQTIENDDWRAELAVGVREYARRFTWERCAQQTWHTYRCIADRQPEQVPAAA